MNTFLIKFILMYYDVWKRKKKEIQPFLRFVEYFVVLAWFILSFEAKYIAFVSRRTRALIFKIFLIADFSSTLKSFFSIKYLLSICFFTFIEVCFRIRRISRFFSFVWNVFSPLIQCLLWKLKFYINVICIMSLTYWLWFFSVSLLIRIYVISIVIHRNINTGRIHLFHLTK